MLRIVHDSHPTPAEAYCSAWARMNEGVDFTIRENEIHYLKTIALSMEDDLASLLLLKKLKLASRRSQQPPGAVGMNSFVEFRFGAGPREIRQLVHPSVCRSGYALSIGTRLGAGLIGLRAGDLLLWPDEDGCPRELQIIAVPGRAHENDGGDPPPLAG